MSDDLNTEIKIGADASGVEAGVGRAKRSLADLGVSAKKAGQDAGAGMAAVGAGGDKAAKDVERATKTMQNSLQRAIAAFEGGEKGSRKFYESLARQRNVDVNALKPLLDQLDAVKTKSLSAAQASTQVGSSFSGLGVAAGLAARAVAAIGIGASVGEFVKMADASTNVASRLGLVTSSAAELASVQARLFGIAQASRVSFVDLVGTYAQVARSTKDLGVSQTALLGVIQTISQAVTISGGSAASAQAALTQLSQGFASGALRGEELNSILEQTPRLAQALADGLGVGVGKLRELGQAGELTSEKVLGALEKSAASVAAEFGKMAVTVEQASTNAANSVLKLVGAFDKLVGVTSVLGGAIQAISKGLDFLTKDVEKLGSQGALRDAAQEVLRLDEYARNLRNGMKNGVFNPNAEAQLTRINAQLAEAKARFRELDQQLSGVKDPRDQTGFATRSSSYTNEAARLAKLRDDANAFRLNQSGVPASYLKDMAELIRLNQAGVIVGKEYTDALKAQQDVLLKKTGAVKGSAAAANAEQNAYESLISSINAKIEADKLEMAGGSALTESQRIRIKLDQDIAAGRVKLSAQNERAVRLALQELKASEASALAAKTLAKANLDAAQSREKYITSLATGLDKIQADIAAQIEATERMGLSKEAIAELDAAKLEMLATDLELQAVKALDRNLDQQTYDALKAQAQAYRELGIAKKGGAAKEAALALEKANADAAKKAQEDWERASEQINSTLTDALMRGFESGKDFAKNMRDTVVNMFKTMVLRPVVSAIVSPISGALLGGLGLAGSAAASQGGGGSGVSTALSGASLLSNIGGSVLGGAGWLTGATTLGGSLSAGASLLGTGTLAGAGAGLGMLAGALGPIALGIAALSSLIKKSTPHTGGIGAYSAASGATTGSSVGLAFGIDQKHYTQAGEDLSTNVAKSIVGILDATATTFGKQAGYYAATAFADDSSKDGAWGALRIKFGEKVLLDWADTAVRDANVPREFADGEAGSKEYLAEVAKSARDAIISIGLPEWAERLAKAAPEPKSLEDLTAMMQQISQYPAQLLQQYGTSRDALVQQFAEGLATGNAAAAGQSVADTLVASIQNAVFTNAAGQIFDIVNMGIVTPMLDAIATGASVADALSQATIDKTIERAKAQAQALGELFGNAEFAAAMEQLRTAVGGALGQAGSYLQTVPQTLPVITPTGTGTTAADPLQKYYDDRKSLEIELATVMGDTGKAYELITAGMSTAEKDAYDFNEGLRAQIRYQTSLNTLREESATLGIDLLRAQGREEEALAAERTKAIEGYDAYQTALYDSNQALRSQIDTLRELGELLPSVIDQYLTPEQRTQAQYSSIASDLVGAGLSGADVGTLAGALESMSKDQIAQAAVEIYNLAGVTDEMRLALVRAVGGLADLKTEADAVAEAARQAAAQQRAGLEGRLLQLQGNTVELRNREVAALEPANRALQRQIYALEDLAAAQGRLDAASNAITTEYLSAQSALESAQQGVAEATRQTAQEMLSFGNSIVEFLNKLQTTGMGNTSPESRYQAAAAQFSSTAALAQSGDRDALGRITSVATDYLGASKDYYASGSGFSMDEGAVKAALQQILGVTGSGTAASAAADPMAKAQEELVKAMERMNEIQAIVSATGVSTSVAATDLLGAFLSAQADVAKATADEAIWRAADKTAWDARDTLQQVLTDASLITSEQTQDSGVTLDYINTSNASIQAAAQTQTTILTAMATSSEATRTSSEKTAQTTESVLNTLTEVLTENRNMASQLAALRQKVAEMESNQRLAASAPAKV